MRPRRLCPGCLRIVREADARLFCRACESLALPGWLRGPGEVRRRVGEQPRPLLERWLLERWRPPSCPRHPGERVELLCSCGAPLPGLLALGSVAPIGIEVLARDPAARIEDAVDGLRRRRPDLRLVGPVGRGGGRDAAWCGRLVAPDRERLLVLRPGGRRPSSDPVVDDPIARRFAAWAQGGLAEEEEPTAGARWARGTAVVPVASAGPGAGDASRAGDGRSGAGRALEWLLRAEIGAPAPERRRRRWSRRGAEAG